MAIFDRGRMGYGGNVFVCGKSGTVAAEDLALGDAVTFPVTVNGTKADYEFFVVHQGKPSSLYDDSCDGTWLLATDVFPVTATFNTADYSTSGVAAAMATIYSGMDVSIKGGVKTVKVPYAYYVAGTGMVVNSGANGYQCNAFGISTREFGYTTLSDEADGTKLDYFNSVTDTQPQAIAKLGNVATAYFTRSGHMSGGGARLGFRVTSSGGCVANTDDAYNVRPAIILNKKWRIRKSWLT